MTGAAADWENYWQGRHDGATGALTGIEHDAELQDFWRAALTPLARPGRFADMACGAGTVLHIASQLGFSDLTGIDVSASALSTLSAALPGVKTCHSSVAATPLTENSFDIITSQFGLEYAGASEAVIEIARLLAPNGVFIAVIHQQGGAIHNEVAGRAAHARAIDAARFIPLSIKLFEAAYSGDSQGMQQVLTQLGPARSQVARLVTSAEPSFAQHLLSGAAQLWERRAYYNLTDIESWFHGMAAELQAFEGRMTSMMAASQTAEDIGRLIALLQDHQIAMAAPQTLQLGGRDAAWVLRTR